MFEQTRNRRNRNHREPINWGLVASYAITGFFAAVCLACALGVIFYPIFK